MIRVDVGSGVGRIRFASYSGQFGYRVKVGRVESVIGFHISINFSNRVGFGLGRIGSDLVSSMCVCVNIVYKNHKYLVITTNIKV